MFFGKPIPQKQNHGLFKVIHKTSWAYFNYSFYYYLFSTTAIMTFTVHPTMYIFLFNKVEDEVDEINTKVFIELEKKLQDS